MSDMSSGNGVSPTPAATSAAPRTNGKVITKAISEIDLSQGFNPYLSEDQLRTWMREKSDPKRKRHQVWHFVLTHEPTSGDLRMVTQESVPKQPDVDRYQAIDELVAKFAYEAGTTAAGGSGPQRFHVEGHLKDDREDPAWDQTTFLISPSLSTLGSETDGLFGVPEGTVGMPAVIGHMQRLLDTSLRLSFTNMQQDKDRMLEQMRDVQIHNEKLMTKHLEQMQLIDTLLDKRDERTLNVYKGKLEIERNEKLYAIGLAALSSYGVPLLARLAGGQLPPELTAGTPLAPGATNGGGGNPVIEFAKTLTPAQLLRFIGDMTEEQQEKFQPIMGVVLSNMTAEQRNELAARMSGSYVEVETVDADTAAEGKSK